MLLLQIGNTFFKLPGGRLKTGENGEMIYSFVLHICADQWTTCNALLSKVHLMLDFNEFFVYAEIEGLKRKLTSKLAPTASSIQPEWQVE